MIRYLTTVLLSIAVALSIAASEPFIGTIRSTRGKPVKGVKVYVENPENVVKTNRKGEFRFDNVDFADSIRIIYKRKLHSFAVSGRSDMMLVVGEDDRIFDRDSYIGETFHGHLIDYKGKPIRGAIVYTSDPFDYIKSDRDGNFLIDNIVETDTLHIKHDGYIHDVAMDGSKGMFIKIMRNTGRKIDDHEVNIGAGSVRRRDYNGPYSVMDAKRLYETATQNVLMAMTAMPGVTYSQGDPQKGIPDNVSIRNSIFKPLWILDGVQMTEPPDITVMELESIEVLADGAIYGTRAAGGVVILTTKASAFKVP